MKYRNAVLKRKLEYWGMLPFVLLGKLYGRLFPLPHPTSTFIFSFSADLGGSIKVNAEIAECVANQQPVVIFSKKPKNNGYQHLFEKEGIRVIDLHKWIDNKWLHFVNFFYRGVVAAWINRSAHPVVFGGETIFFYKVIPHVKKEAVCVELCHVDTWFNYNIGFIDLITYRVFSTRKMMELVEKQYRDNQLPPSYFDRLRFIENSIPIPDYAPTANQQLEVVFIGRGSPQKRVHLTAAIAQKMHELQAPVHFSFVGDVTEIIHTANYPYCTFYGNVRDETLMQDIYRRSDVLILTSAFEGLPLVVMQMMAYGRVVLSTAVNSIPDYIAHRENGLLITATKEAEIINEGVAHLQLLINDPSLKISLGKRSREIAIEKFNSELFCKQYRRLFYAQQ